MKRGKRGFIVDKHDAPELEATVGVYANALKATLPKGVLFILFLLNEGPEGFTAYASTCVREDALKAVREWLENMESAQGGGDA